MTVEEHDTTRGETNAAEVPTGVRRNPLLRIRFDDGIVCDLLLHGRTVRVPDGRHVAALGLLDAALPTDEAVERIAGSVCGGDVDAALDVLAHLLRSGMVTDAGAEFPELPAVRHWVDRGWLDALIFHLRCATVRFDDDGVSAAGDAQSDMLREVVAGGVPQPWTRYADAPVLALPPGRDSTELPPLEEILLKRRSNRPWRKNRIDATELATILSVAGGELVAARRTVERDLPATPAALLHSAFSALEIYVVPHAVDGVAPGIHHYAPDTHTLHEVRSGEFRDELTRMCVGQQRAGSGAATFVITGVWERYMFRYRYPHAYRTLLVNAAELAQKLILAATGTGLSTFLTPAFDDQFADELFGFDPVVQTPIEVVSVG